MAKVTLTLDTSDPNLPPKFSFVPLVLPITKRGKETIHWKPGSSNFSFAAIAFTGQNPFQNVVVSDTEITAIDDNEREEDHKYVVLVRVHGTYYSSAAGLM